MAKVAPIDWNLIAAIIGFSLFGLFVLGVCVWLWWTSEAPPHDD